MVAERTFGPIAREDLRRYAEASGDLNPLHLDPEFAGKQASTMSSFTACLAWHFSGASSPETLGPQGLRLLALSSPFPPCHPHG